MSQDDKSQPKVYYWCTRCGVAVYQNYAQGRDKGDLCFACELTDGQG